MNVLPEIHKAYHHLDATNPFTTYFSHIPDVPDSRSRSYYGDSHYDLQICIVMVGEHEVMYPDHKTSVKSGQLWLTSCWEPHATRIPSRRIMFYVITISVEALGSAAPFQDVDWFAPFFMRASGRPQAESVEQRLKVLSFGRALRALEKKKPYGWKTSQWLKIHELIVYMASLMRQGNEDGSAGRQSGAFISILPAVQIVKQSPWKNVSLGEAASVCGLSKSRFSSVFSQVMGVSFGRFSLRVKISNAAQMLRGANSSIKDVAGKSGFKDLSHFYHVFGKFFHCTPHEFVTRSGAE